MKKVTIDFNNSSTDLFFDASFDQLETVTLKTNTVIITDENVYNKNKKKFKGWNQIVIKPGEKHKVQSTVDSIIKKLIAIGANRKTFIVGAGGGVVTDIAGYVAGIYMRGLKFGFIPTSILAMADAAIGGKNGIDVGVYKNIIGLIRQPSFLLYDYSLLKSLPKKQWINGFAEIIKHACIKDEELFTLLELHKLTDFVKDKVLLDELIQRNALLKCKFIQQDEFEQGDRKLLNFGHTFGHAIENNYSLPHGYAVAIGMVVAAVISETHTQFRDISRLTGLIKKYSLPVYLSFKAKKVLEVMRSDKKKVDNTIDYVLLEKIGKGVLQPLSLEDVGVIIQQLENRSNKKLNSITER